MLTTVGKRYWKSRGVMLAAALMLVCLVAGVGEGFEPHYPANDQLRATIRDVLERQAVRPPQGLEKRVREALRSINEVEGQTDATTADHLATDVKAAWRELERARAVGALGYVEFDDEKFRSAEARFEAITAQFSGVRAPLPAEGYRAVAQGLSEVQALSRAARAAVPGLSSDDVLLMRAKRQRLLIKDPRGEDGLPAQSNSETGSR